MTDHLPDVKVTPDQPHRILDVVGILSRGGLPELWRAARLIVHQTDRIAELNVTLTELRESFNAVCNRRDELAASCACAMPAGCPVIFERGHVGTCTACGKNFECGAKPQDTARTLLERAEELFQDECDPVTEPDSYAWLQAVREHLRRSTLPADRLREAERLLRAAYEGDESKWPDIGHWLAQCTPETTEGRQG